MGEQSSCGVRGCWVQVAAVCGLAYGGFGCETGLGANSG